MELGLKTREDIEQAMMQEAQACEKYMAYAEKADEEGFHQVGRIFRAAAYAADIHVSNCLWMMDAVNDTRTNLQDAMEQENLELLREYEMNISDADSEGLEQARTVLGWELTGEHEQQELLREAVAELGYNPEVIFWICSSCGHIHKAEAPEECPVCAAPQSAFNEVG